MKPIAYRLFVATSVLGTFGMLGASTRPHYGGTLRVELQAPNLPGATGDELAAMAPWIFDGLVRLDSQGNIQPALAASWQHEPGGTSWKFKLRDGVKWHDGSALTGDQVAAALAGCAPGGRINATEDTVEISFESPHETLPMILATSPGCLVRRPAAPGTSQGPMGTGAFRLSEWQPGRRAVLLANDDYWGGRPYLDRVEVQLNRPSRDEILDLEVDHADVVELDPPEARRARQENKFVWTSAPVEMLAIQFFSPSADQRDARLALALSLDRATIQKALLQNYGEPAASLFPSWISGYSFLFSTQPDIAQARKLAGQAGRTVTWKLDYDSADALNRVVAERIALNAREAGLQLQPVAVNAGLGRPNGAAGPAADGPRGNGAEARLVRYRIPGPNLECAARQAAEAVGFPAPADPQPQKIYEAEKAFLESGAVIPIAYVPELFGLSSRVHNWSPTRWGSLNLAEVWLAPSEP